MYDDIDAVDTAVGLGRHREVVGGLWDELGLFQLKLMVERGLRPGMRLLDIGCGCLRGGVHFIRYLNPGNYFGVDRYAGLLAAGYERELASAGLCERLPRGNLLATWSFEFDLLGTSFDMAIAQSLFTHLPSEEVTRCLTNLGPVLVAGGVMVATFFECPHDHEPSWPLTHDPAGIVTFRDRDPFHYSVGDMERLGEDAGLDVKYVGACGHPRGQRVVLYVKP